MRAAADKLGIPTTWVWRWVAKGRVHSEPWLRSVFVRLEDVEEAFADLDAVKDAFYATLEPISSQRGAKQALAQWPNLTGDIIHPSVSRLLQPVAMTKKRRVKLMRMRIV